ncbi:DUF3445 domain-containing protein [Kineococcus glutinatus]|uniref:DUF3445 domain-containing protein n=1 Tax=Kineococcus glutinatus TaxID=1070872 RepID=A0ABP9H409_9ACTN
MTTTDLPAQPTGTDLPERVRRFPWPFPADRYRYSANVEPAARTVTTTAGAWGERLVDVDADHHHELAAREQVLRADPSRCAVLAHMVPATWDAMLFLMREMSSGYPASFALRRLDDGSWHWRNDLLGLEQRFVVGNASTLPADPLRYIGAQVQEDLVLLDQREDALWADAALVTSAADWSVNFDVGMSFLQIHGPVPRVHEEGVVPRAQQFLLRLQPGEPYRRTNWTMTVDRRLDTATETYPQWGPDRSRLTAADVGRRLHLRVEVQHLLRLPDSGCILFLIRTHLLSLAEIAAVPAWRRQLASVLAELPQDMVDYKGLTRFRDMAVTWLQADSPQ